MELMDRVHQDRSAGDPAHDAARVITEEAMSILLAVEARAAELDADARREAEEIRREADQATAPALVRLRAMARDLEALATDLDDAVRARAERRHDD
jgi:hypothetical protein